MTPPYVGGEPVRFLVMGDRGTTLTDGHVEHIAPTDNGWRVDVSWPRAATPEGKGFGRFYVDTAGASDYLSAGHTSTCFDCGGALPVSRGGSLYGFRWRGPRSELVHFPICPQKESTP